MTSVDLDSISSKVFARYGLDYMGVPQLDPILPYSWKVDLCTSPIPRGGYWHDPMLFYVYIPYVLEMQCLEASFCPAHSCKQIHSSLGIVDLFRFHPIFIAPFSTWNCGGFKLVSLLKQDPTLKYLQCLLSNLCPWQDAGNLLLRFDTRAVAAPLRDVVRILGVLEQWVAFVSWSLRFIVLPEVEWGILFLEFKSLSFLELGRSLILSPGSIFSNGL